MAIINIGEYDGKTYGGKRISKLIGRNNVGYTLYYRNEKVVYHTEGKKFAVCAMDYLCERYGFEIIFSEYSSDVKDDSKNKKSNAHYLLGGIKSIYVDRNPDILCEKVANMLKTKNDSAEFILEYDVVHPEYSNTDMKYSYVSPSVKKQALVDRQLVAEIDAELDDLHLEGKDRDAIIKIRVNQGEFRKRLLKKYDSCCLCDVTNPHLLIASHIKPWSECEDKEERLDPDNGFLLCPNHDKLFDQGYISFDDDGTILISPQLTSEEILCMHIDNSKSIGVNLNEKNKYYLRYHKENRFNKKDTDC